jgi:hypothetical protein
MININGWIIEGWERERRTFTSYFMFWPLMMLIGNSFSRACCFVRILKKKSMQLMWDTRFKDTKKYDTE